MGSCSGHSSKELRTYLAWVGEHPEEYEGSGMACGWTMAAAVPADNAMAVELQAVFTKDS